MFNSGGNECGGLSARQALETPPCLRADRPLRNLPYYPEVMIGTAGQRHRRRRPPRRNTPARTRELQQIASLQLTTFQKPEKPKAAELKNHPALHTLHAGSPISRYLIIVAIVIMVTPVAALLLNVHEVNDRVPRPNDERSDSQYDPRIASRQAR